MWQMSSDLGQDALCFFHYLIVRKSYYFQPSSKKNFTAFVIIFFLFFMNITIHLNHQRSSVTIEVDDKTINDLLATKMPTIVAICPQLRP